MVSQIKKSQKSDSSKNARLSTMFAIFLVSWIAGIALGLLLITTIILFPGGKFWQNLLAL